MSALPTYDHGISDLIGDVSCAMSATKIESCMNPASSDKLHKNAPTTCWEQCVCERDSVSGSSVRDVDTS